MDFCGKDGPIRAQGRVIRGCPTSGANFPPSFHSPVLCTSSSAPSPSLFPNPVGGGGGQVVHGRGQLEVRSARNCSLGRPPHGSDGPAWLNWGWREKGKNNSWPRLQLPPCSTSFCRLSRSAWVRLSATTRAPARLRATATARPIPATRGAKESGWRAGGDPQGHPRGGEAALALYLCPPPSPEPGGSKRSAPSPLAGSPEVRSPLAGEGGRLSAGGGGRTALFSLCQSACGNAPRPPLFPFRDEQLLLDADPLLLLAAAARLGRWPPTSESPPRLSLLPKSTRLTILLSAENKSQFDAMFGVPPPLGGEVKVDIGEIHYRKQW